jgi:hypothetical protein
MTRDEREAEMNSMSPATARPPATIRHRANPLLLLPGLLLIIVGIVVMVAGFAWAALGVLGIDSPQPEDLGRGPNAGGFVEPLMSGFAVFTIGCTVMTIGRYLWRGARRRGWRDRLGRFLIILGYLDICAAFVVLTQFIIAAATDFDGNDAGTNVIVRGLLICLAILVPGALLTGSGFRLAKEQPLMTAEVKATF